jgi:hypothetical protein
MGKMNIKSWVSTFYKKNKLPIWLFVIASLLWFVSGLLPLTEDQKIPPAVTLLDFTSYLVLLVALMVLFGRSERNLLASLSFMVILVVGLEIVCFFLLGMPEKQVKDFSLADLPPEHIGSQVGGVPWGDSTHHDVKYADGKKVYDIHFTIDDQCKRVTPDYDSTKTEHAVFFGCSIAFGFGLEDNETIPYCFQQKSKAYNSYNYAYTGYGTHHMLSRLQYQDLSEQVNEKDGIGVYVFFWDHVYRAIGAMSRYTSWGHDGPYFEMKDGKLVRNKALKDGRSFVSKMYEMLHQTSIINYFELDFPNSLRDSHYELVAEMILESKKTYKKQFGDDDEFYVLIHPSYAPTSDFSFDTFKKYLDKKEIKYVDLYKFIDYGSKHTLGGDPHPNKDTAKLVAEEFFKRINTDK